MAEVTKFGISFPAKEIHTHTVIFLHDYNSNCEEFAAKLFESEASELSNQPRTLQGIFPNVKWVFPAAPELHSKRYGIKMSQWFDIWSLEYPWIHSDIQKFGLRRSANIILQVVTQEELLVPRERIFLAGISQGFATVITAFLHGIGTPERFAGLIGLNSWIPNHDGPDDISSFLAELKIPEHEILHIQRLMGIISPSRRTPVFLGHAVDDEIVQVPQGRLLRDTLQSMGLTIDWREYPDGGHWINVPQGVNDIVDFMKTNM